VFLFAGHETTANLIGNGLLALLRHPDQLELLRARPDLTQSAVEELLRYDSPVQRNRRLATRDLAFGGKQIKQGDAVMVFMGSANRDDAKFPHPDTLDIARAPNQHMAFGHGIHFCAGAALSRLEAPIAIRALLDRYPKLRLSDGFEEHWHRNITFRGLESLEVRLD
jgi:cytochrome P450